MRVVGAAEMRALEARAIARGTPGHVLTERAGRGAARVAARMLRGRRGSVVIVCGRGNNGGDGFVVARWLRRQGRRVDVWLLGEPEAVNGDAARMLGAWRRAGGRVASLRTRSDVVELSTRCGRAALLVDALLGTGLNAPVSGRTAEAVATLNAAGVPILGIDIASGLSADTGQPLGTAVHATVSASFGLAKIGQCLWPGIEYTGELEVVDIGLSREQELPDWVPTETLEPGVVGGWLPRRPRGGHKGTFGHVLVVAGSRGKLGAALLAAEGAERGGAGLTTLAVPASLQPMAEGRVPEVMTAAVGDDGTGCGAPESPERMRELIVGRDAVVCGPGLGRGEGPAALVAALLERVEAPMVLDADALNAVAGTGLLRGRSAASVITPHPGEMARLVGSSVAEVQADRVGTARRFATEERVVVVLKGARTVIASPDGRVAICTAGNPGLASGGTGDVLAGLIGGLLAQRVAPFEAAGFAVLTHALAADAIAERRGEVGLLARDVLAEIPATIGGLQRGQPS